ncbi:MAG: 6-carboxytetrahydropterin synthase QueD [Ideonella sp.]|nr:6-carboxytetrahydropterin synthase QueD [Ideonella sp.]
MPRRTESPPVLQLRKAFRFEAAHRLPRVPAGHPCGTLHGHSYRVELHLRGPLDPELGWVVDFGEVSRVAKPLIALLDHACLNDLPGLENPTSEHLCVWLADRLAPDLPTLVAVEVRETESSVARYDLPAGPRA